jgi:hypothetical protein
LLAIALASPLVGAGREQSAATPPSIDEHRGPSQPVSEAARVKVQRGYGQLPLSFEANQGQADERVQFLAHGDGYSLFLTRTEAVLALFGTADPVATGVQPMPAARNGASQPRRGSVLRMTLIGGNPATPAIGVDELPGKSHYFVGNDPKQWRSNVPTYGQVRFAGVYPGVDLVYYGNQRQLEYDFVVGPGADPSTIQLGFAGAERMEIDAQGELTLQTSGGDVRWRKPVAYQEVGGRRQTVDAHYVRKGTEAVGFAVSHFNPGLPLVIDPVLVYSTYLGFGASATSITVDASGSAYVTGSASSFPTTSGAFRPNPILASDAIVAKLNPAGNALIYATYLGGNGNSDGGTGIAVDASGHAYVTGRTNSTNFPTTLNAYDNTVAGVADAFLTKLDPSGSALLYSTYLGGGGNERGQGVAADSAGYAYVTGFTESTDFPTQNAPQTTLSGTRDAFVTKLDTTLAGLASLVYSTYLGGSLEENGFGNTNQLGAIAVDGSGHVYVTGSTDSDNFPTVNAFQTTLLGGFNPNVNAYVTKIDPSLSGPPSLIFSTYLGTGGSETGTGIAVDASGSAYVTGAAWSVPTTAGAFQVASAGSSDAFVTKLTPDGSSLVYSTYLGGSTQDLAFAIAVDPSGFAYVTGYTFSTNFPTVNAVQASPAGPVGGLDAFVTKLTLDGSGLVYSTYLGGSGNDAALAIAAGASGAAYVAGTTNSTNFPLANPFQGIGGVPSSAFVSKISENNAPTAEDDAYATDEDTDVTATLSVLANDSDADGDSLTAALVTNPAHGSVTFNGDGSFFYRPNANYAGPDNFTYKANDGRDDSNVATVTITLTPVNDPPEAFDDVYVTPEDTPLTVGLLAGVHSNDTDVDGDQLHATEVSGPSHGTLSLADDGSFSYTPAANYDGPDSFTYRTSDAQLDSNVATVSITVTSVVEQTQTISFAPLPDRTLGDPPFALTATASSGLPVTFAVQGECSIAGTTVTLLAVGSCEVTASQDGNVIFSAAPPVVQQFVISPPVVTAAPVITSADHTTFRAGANGSFLVTTTGTPTPALTHAPAVAGQIGLPPGVTFVDNGDRTGTLSGTPAPFMAGVYAIQITAANGIAPDAVQTFTLTVEDLPRFWTGDTATFRAGTASTFVVSALGVPTPVVSLDSGTLPAGISFDPAPTVPFDGTLQGTPTTPGVYPLTLKASNAVGDTFQSFTLTIVNPPDITVTPQNPTLDVGATQTFSASSGGRVLPNASVVQLVTGSAHSCALLTDGTVTCWGYPFGTAPAPIAGLSAVSQIGAGGSHTCALLTDLTVRCWGNNGFGQLGGVAPPDPITPTPVLDASFNVLTDVQAIAAGEFFTCARVTDGTVRCWGGIAPGSTAGLTDVTAMAAGGRHACVLRAPVKPARCSE